MLQIFYLILVLCAIQTSSEDEDKIPEIAVLNTKLRDLIVQNNITSNPCIFDILDVVDALNQKQMWAIRMIDATAKIQSGFALGNFINFGSYDECLSVEGKGKSRTIKGKYCIFALFFTNFERPNFTYAIPDNIRTIMDEYKGIPIIESICVPDSCTAEDLTEIFNNTDIPETMAVRSYFTDEYCQVKDEETEFTVFHGLFLFLIVSNIFLLIVCTSYDLYLLRYEQKPYHIILLSFSLYTNIKQLTKIKKDPDQLPCIHGIRTLSVAWIILGHRYLLINLYPHTNYLYSLEWVQETSSSLVTGALFAVDTFFLISGLLVMYVVLLAKAQDFEFNLIYYYLLRAFRLTPALIMLILFYMSYLKDVSIGLGPSAPFGYKVMSDGCVRHWWYTVTFIQNYVDSKNMCVSHSWYLAVDTQLYNLAPILFIPIQRWPKATLIFIVALLIFSIVYGFIVTWNLELSASFLAIGNSVNSVYASTLIRSSAWLVGSLLGYYLFVTRRKRIVIHKGIVIFLWILSLAIMSSLIYMQAYFNQNEYVRVYASLYHALSKPLWCISLAWIIFACVHGHSAFVNKFLSNKVFIVLGRLSYSMYLVHVFVLYYKITGTTETEKFSNANEIYLFWGDYVYSVLLGTVWSLCFESPVIAVGKALMPKKMADRLTKINKENEATFQQLNNAESTRL